MRLPFLCLAAIALTACSAQASVITGDMEMGGMVINIDPVADTISFLPGLVPSGNFGVSMGSSGDFLPLVGTYGNVSTFSSIAGPQSVANFISLFGAPSLSFELIGVDAGVFASTLCNSSVLSAVPGQTCTPAGEVGNWINTSANTSTASISIRGDINNGGDLSNFTAVFSATFGEPFQAIFGGSTPVSSTGTGSGSLTITPEPSGLIFCGIGLLGVILYRLKLSAKSLG